MHTLALDTDSALAVHAGRKAPRATHHTSPDFVLEKPAAQAEVDFWWPIMTAIYGARKTGDMIKEQAKEHHLDWKKVERMYYGWDKTFSYEALINRSKFPNPHDANLPPAFVQHLCTRQEGHQRKRTATRAISTVMAQLAAWERNPQNDALAIPGYARPPKRNSFTGVPDGWGLRNLQNTIKENTNRFTDALRKIGPQTASIYLPNVHTTRTRMYFGEVLYFDDDQLDTQVNLTGVNDKALRGEAFTCMEAYSESIFQRAYKPQIQVRDAKGVPTGAKRVLNADDFFWFVISVLMTYGYRADKVTWLVFEWGTANIDKRSAEKFADHFDNMISQVTGGHVRVDRSGRYTDPAFKGMVFGGDGSGNFRYKAHLEGWFNLFRNYASLLPAATGKDRHHAPEENKSLLAYNAGVLKQLDTMPRDRFKRMRRPVLEWEDFVWASRIITEIIDKREDHKIEGWDKLGFRKQFYRVDLNSENWMSEEAFNSLPDAERAALAPIVSQPGYFRSFRMSPHDVKEAHLNLLTRLPSYLIPKLAPPRMWKPVTIRQNLEIWIEANNIEEYVDSEDLIYIAKVRNSHGHEVNLERGKKYFRLLNVFNPDLLWIAEHDAATGQRGKYIGVATRVQTGGKMDHEQILEQVAAISHVKSVETADVRRRTTDAAVEDRLDMRENNKRVRAGAEPKSIEEKQQAKRETARVIPMEQFAETSKHEAPEIADPSDFL